MNSPTQLISHPDVVFLGMRAASGEDAIRQLHQRLSALPGVVSDPALLLVDLLERSRLATVCIDGDIALPHARTGSVQRLVLAIGRADGGIAFEREHPGVRLVFLVGTPKDALAEYLQMVAALSRLLRNPVARGALLSAPDEKAFRELLGFAAA